MKRSRDEAVHSFEVHCDEADEDEEDGDMLRLAAFDQTVCLGEGIRMRAELDPFNGGITWFPLGEHDPDPGQRQHLRLYYPPMLHDEKRNQVYAEGIAAAVQEFIKTHSKPPLVLDIGTGTGLLSMLAARAGASHVFSIEGDPTLAPVARAVIAKNGLASKVTVIQKHSTEVQLGADIPRRCDLIVSELLDSELIGEGVLPSLKDAYERLLADHAQSVPRSAVVYGQLLESECIRQCHEVPSAAADKAACGRLRTLAVDVKRLNKPRRLSEAISLFDFDFSKAGLAPIDVRSGTDAEGAAVGNAVTVEFPVQVLDEKGDGSQGETDSGAAVAHGLLIYWTMEMWPGCPAYSTRWVGYL
jgi:predicted RNA methylase